MPDTAPFGLARGDPIGGKLLEVDIHAAADDTFVEGLRTRAASDAARKGTCQPAAAEVGKEILGFDRDGPGERILDAAADHPADAGRRSIDCAARVGKVDCSIRDTAGDVRQEVTGRVADPAARRPALANPYTENPSNRAA